MHKIIVLFFFTILFAMSCHAQAPLVEWQNSIGGSSFEFMQSIQKTSDGGYITGGRSYSGISGDKTDTTFGLSDFWIVKLDALGAIVWQKSIGGNNLDYVSSIRQTPDDGFIIGGYSYSGVSGNKSVGSNGGSDYWIVKIDTYGNIEWQKNIGGNSDDILSSMQLTSEGGFVLAGYSFSGISGDKSDNNIGGSDYWIVKIDASGTIEWQRTIGGDADDYLYSIQQTADNNYILGGSSVSGISGNKTELNIGGDDYWFVVLDESGNILWQKTIGGSDNDILYAVQQTTEGSYILGGYSYSDISGDKTEDSYDFYDDELFIYYDTYDFWIIKLNSTGEIVWEHTLGGTGWDVLTDLQITEEGELFVGGYSDSNISGDKSEHSRGYMDYWLLMLNDAAEIIWQKTIGGSGFDYLYNIQQTAPSEYILGGYSFSYISGDKTENTNGFYDYWVLKLACAESVYYLDTDGDGFGNPEHPMNVELCNIPSDFVSNNLDCDDANADVYISTVYYADMDSDGFGDITNAIMGCEGITPSGYVTDTSDCDDTQWLYTDADGDSFGTGDPVACGVPDNSDCDDTQILYEDNDGDGFGFGIPVACGDVLNNIDCDDTQWLYVDADGDSFGTSDPVACGVPDNSDCDDTQILYEDNDGDGFGFGMPVACGDVLNNIDCDDTQWLYTDADGDGFGTGEFVACGLPDNTDCDDTNAGVFTPFLYYQDADGDGFGNPEVEAYICTLLPSEYVVNNADCDDTNPDINLLAIEILNGLDDNCNGEIDEGLVGINTIEPTTFKIYPNPTNAEITIEITNGSTLEKQITITDVLQNVVLMISTTENKITLDVQQLASGMYFICIKTEAGFGLHKFVKE